jgi:hypothetical protein
MSLLRYDRNDELKMDSCLCRNDKTPKQAWGLNICFLQNRYRFIKYRYAEISQQDNMWRLYRSSGRD